MFFKEDNKQVFHYEFFKEKIMNLLIELNPNSDYVFKTKDYECIPRFRYTEKDQTLYIPNNFEFSEMVISQLIRDLGLNTMIKTLEIEKTVGENIKELKEFPLSKKVILI